MTRVNAGAVRLSLFLLACCTLFASLAVAQKQRLVVAQDGSGDYKTVQAALDAVPQNNPNRITILIKKGIYREKLSLDSTRHYVTLIGEDKANTTLTYDDYSGKTLADGTKLTTSTSGSFYIFANDFRAENLTFENTAGPVGQAVAAFVTGDRAVFINCRFLGFQDTLYTGSPRHYGRQYYKDCYIEGTTDFIFGSATAVFDHCTIFSKKGGQYITAASTPEGKPFGYVFVDCTLIGDAPKAGVYLGRPWRNFAQTVFIRTRMGKHIRPEGWHNWSKPDAEKTAFYAEYGSEGPGAYPQTRVAWSKQLTKEEVQRYDRSNVLAGHDQWKPLLKATKVNF
ncbi:pectinesterase family protein [Nibrella viscosa]|uniref:pectinesterase family protein n=1 Tax=Nibrella viscosa TaxID=1084524 RepID=UPI0031EFED56